MPIKDFIHHYPRALFNDIPRGRCALSRHTRVGTHFYDIPGSGRSLTTYPGQPTSIQTGAPQGPFTNTILHLHCRAPVQVMVYADDITTHLHTKACVQPRNTYNHTYIKFLPGKNNLTPNLAFCSLQTLQNIIAIWTAKKHCTPHGNVPKGSGPYHSPKTHIQHTHSQPISTSTQATTNDKIHSPQQDGVNRRRHLQGSHEIGYGVCLVHMVAVVGLPRPMEGSFHRTASSTTDGWSRWNF